MTRKVLICPRCGSDRIHYNLITAEYECEDCSYAGPLIVEEETPSGVD